MAGDETGADHRGGAGAGGGRGGVSDGRWVGLSVVVIAAGAIALLVLRALLPQLTPDQTTKASEKPTARTLSGYSTAGSWCRPR